MPRGVAVRDSNGDVYVVDSQNNRIQRFDSLGGFVSAWGRDVVVAGGVGDSSEVQAVTVGGGATGGSFTLSFGATAPTTTDPVAFGAAAGAVDAALEALGGIGAGGVSVTGSAGGPYTVEFTGPRASIDQPQITADASGLTPAGTVGVATGKDGASFEICTVAAQCKAGSISTGPGNPTAATALGNGGTFNGPQGIAVNQTTGDVYVSNANGAVSGYRRIEQFEADGDFVRAWGADVVSSGAGQADEVQTVTVTATGGSFTLTFNAQTTVALPYNTPASGGSNPGDSVQNALNALSTIGGAGGSVTVTGGPGDTAGSTPYRIAFGGTLAATNVAQITAASAASPNQLTGGTPTSGVTAATQNGGATGFEVCNNPASCKAGVAGTNPMSVFGTTMGYPAVVSAGPSAGNVLVGDSNRRVAEFTAAGAFVRTFGWGVVSAGPSNTTSNEFEICRASVLDICATGATGAGVGQFGGGLGIATPDRVAVDTAGSIYTVEATTNFRVQKFTSSGASLTPSLFNPSIGGSETLSGTAMTDTPTDVAVDTNGDLNPANDRVFVVKAFPAGTGIPAATAAERRVLEFDTAGSLVETHLANSGLNSVNGLAIKTGGQPGYLTSGTPQAGFYEIGIATPPTVAIQPTTDVTTSCATLHGTVNPNGGGSLTTTYRFEYSANGGTDWTRIPAGAPINIGNGNSPVAVQQTPCGLQPNKAYTVRLVAIKGGESTNSTGTAGDFTTDPAPPTVQTFPAYWDTVTDELVLRGSVNPSNTQTSYWFEYGTEPCSSSDCESFPLGEDASAGSGGQQIDVSQRLAGLDRETNYHFRIVADNGVGDPVEGDDLQFTTPADVECANETLREANDSTGLPDCRALEWVSNGDSGGSGIYQISRLSIDGDRAQFLAAGFGQPESQPAVGAPYVASRGEGGWSVGAALPPRDRAANGDLNLYYLASGDLSRVLWPAVSRAEAQRMEVQWVFADLAGGFVAASSQLVPVARTGSVPQNANYVPSGASSDLSTFVFGHIERRDDQGMALLPGESPLDGGGVSNVYVVTGAGTAEPVLGMVNRATDPAPGVPGEQIGGTCGAGVGGQFVYATNGTSAGAVSDDGSVIYFSAVPGATTGDGSTCRLVTSVGKRLFKRVDDSVTVAVSDPVCDRVASPGVPACGTTLPSGAAVPDGPDQYRGASGDGSIVFFTSPRQLTSSDTDATGDLYVYDDSPPGGGEPGLVQASAGEEVDGDHPVAGRGAEVASVVGVSGDGSRAYFTARGRLVPEAVKDEVNLYVYERDDEHEDGRVGLVGTLESGTGSFSLAPQDGDGRFLVFATETPLTADDTDSSQDVYRYDDESGELVCVSCMGSGAFDVLVSSGAVSEDGSTITLTTSEALMERDDNDAPDVYVWRDGQLGWVSQGSGADGAGFYLGANNFVSRDGKGVFFYTRAKLNPADTNNSPDVYVARIDGGFAPPSPKPDCGSDAECQGAPGDAPGVNTPDGSASTGNTDAGERVSLKLAGLSAAQRRQAARSGVVSVGVRLDRPGLVRVQAKARIAKRLRNVGHGSKRLAEAGLVTVRVPLNRTARRRLARTGRLGLSIQARSDGARPRSVRVVLARAGR